MAAAVIRDAVSEADIEAVRELFLEYQAAIGVDLCFQGFREELETLPGAYARPSGRLLVAVEGRSFLGCVGLRSLGGDDCEIKRLYVRPNGRGAHLGRRLVAAVLDEAREAGYRRILLDTLPTMSEAIALYRSFGFTDTARYCHNPIAGALYLALSLPLSAPPNPDEPGRVP
jgi:putative acetyltransferase